MPDLQETATSSAEEPLAGGAAAANPDRLTALLRLIAAGLLVVVLVFALVFVVYLKGLGAPRSAAERDIARFKDAVAAQPEDLLSRISLAYAYSAGARFDEALETIERAGQMTDDPQARVELARADILRAAGRLEEAVEAYNLAATLAEAEHVAAVAERAKSRIFTEVPNELLAQALHGRGIASWDLGDSDSAIADLAAAIEIVPTDAAMLVTLAGFQAKSGETSAAAASYRRALEFVPDYAAAIEGLRNLDEER